MKKIASACLLVLVFFTLPGNAHAQQKNKYRLLWRIEGNGLVKPSYLFGTMHVKDARAFGFSDSVMLAIDRCEAFALEIHPDTLMNSVFGKMFSNDTIRSFQNIFHDRDIDKLSKRFEEENGYSIDKSKIKNPIVLDNLMKMKKARKDDKETFVDAYLFGIARTLGKPVFGLEKVEDQWSFFNKLPDEYYKKGLDDVLNDSEDEMSHLEKLTLVYSAGDLQAIEDLSYGLRTYDSLMVVRNRVMVKSMLEVMKSKTLFTAVGAAHLPGKDGVIDLLTQQGYKCTPVMATFTGTANKYKIDPMKMEWVTYTDSTGDFSLSAPGGLSSIDLFPGMKTLMHTDLTTGMIYGIYSIKIPGMGANGKEDEFINRIVKAFKGKSGMEVIKSKKAERNGMKGMELILKTGKETFMRSFITIADNHFYWLFVGNKTEQIKQPSAEKFLNSFAIKSTNETAKKNDKWFDLVVKQGAFSVQLPAEPKTMIKEVKDYDDEEKEQTTFLNIYMAPDFGSMTNYLVRWNDYPVGLYIQNKEMIYQSLAFELGVDYDKLDTVWTNGIEGREMILMLKDEYYSVARVYVRGNRIYLIIKQNLKADEMSIRDDNFFPSFTFLPYEQTEPVVYTDTINNFEIKLPAKPRIEIDTAGLDYAAPYENSIMCRCVNPNSGGLYQFEKLKLKKYFKAAVPDSFFHRNMRDNLNYNDSIIKTSDFTVDGIHGLEFHVYKGNNDNTQRIRMWMYNGYFYKSQVYIGEDEMFNDVTGTFFESFRMPVKEEEKFPLNSSKIDLIANDLHSTDTTLRENARGALSYYDIDENDLSKVYALLEENWEDDTTEEGTRIRLIRALGNAGHVQSVEFLKKLFQNTEGKPDLRAEILAAIPVIDPKKGIESYFSLLVNAKPIEATSMWDLFRPLRDSIEFAKAHFDELIPFIDSKVYRNEIISLANTIGYDSLSGGFLEKYLDRLTKYAFEELEEDMKDSEGEKFGYGYSATPYLSLMYKCKPCKITDAFTNKVLASKAENYAKATAMSVRIKWHLPIDKKIQEKLLNDMNSRYEILGTYIEINELNKVSQKYTKPEELAKMISYYYNTEETDIDKITLLGNVTQHDSVYYAFEFTVKDDEEKSKYLSVTGPFVKGKPVSKLDEYITYSDWEPKARDWKKQAAEYIKEMKEW